MRTVWELIVAARPRQWTKNLVCLAALIFAGELSNPISVRKALWGFLCYCLASSAIYILNDLMDLEQDRLHPAKRNRPIAAGRLGAGTALAASIVLLAAVAGVCYFFGARYRWLLAIFLTLNILYSLGLKRIAIVDVMSIAVGFVLRVQSGIEAIQAPQSEWIILCMFFMALFLGFGKRRGEITSLQGDPLRPSRPVLQEYSVQFLDIMLGLSATTAVVCYSLYAVTVQVNETFLLTILPVAYGIVRYLMLVIVRTEGEGPDEMLTRDAPLMLTVLIWAFLCVGILYFQIHLFPSRLP
jgi:4-hydroxybenzoate polyprenyltransferase